MWYEMLLNDDMVKLDSHDVQRHRKDFKYKEVASRFKMIDDDTRSVIVPWPASHPHHEKIDWILSCLRNNTPCSITDYRELQDLTVSLRNWQIKKCLERELLVRIGSSDMYEWIGSYDDQTGLVMEHLYQKDLII